MLHSIAENISAFKKLDKESALIYIYRYFSLLVSSIFYLISDLGTSFKNKLFVIVLMASASVIMNELFAKSKENKSIVIVLSCLDILGNVFILIPTGGLTSPYIWHSFNTLLITINYLNIYYTGAIAALYVLFSSEIYSYFSRGRFISLLEIIKEEYNFILAYLLITAAAYELLTLLKHLARERKSILSANNELIEANCKIKSSVEHLMSLYKAVNYLNHESSIHSALKIIMEYSHRIIKSSSIFLYLFIDGNTEVFHCLSDDINKDKLLADIKRRYFDKNRQNDGQIFSLGESEIICSFISTSQNQYGFLGFRREKSLINNKFHLKEDYENSLLQLNLLCEICSLVLEKINLEKINNHLILSQEKNRIAEEIHDGVCQKLFSISCSIQWVKKKLPEESKGLVEELNFIGKSLSECTKELREAVYGLSWRKFGENMFMKDLHEYIYSVSKLHKVKINFIPQGSDEFMIVQAKNAVYRIISEGVSNAIRHGQADLLQINLNMFRENTILIIKDNGRGFHLQGALKDKSKGLGLENIYNMVEFLGGRVNIDSNSCETIININLPNKIPTCISYCQSL
ncbi:sensor histidine kinase [Clostridium polynesiense]|uniref:sensor histidine kinase n=1 Tax=Clostridium polynesiense TaxID=1325933 RepID=UPI00058D5D2C|nr:histidine kinase [Clostridium polynesiense]